MINILITLLVVAIIVGLIWWVCDYMPVPEPINKFVKLIAIVVGVIIIVMALLGIAGYNTGLPVRP
jgi:multisubunit Na+/H+ antiporter MnhB subunit